MPTLVLAVDQYSWMMSGVVQVPTSYWSALADQSSHTTASTLLMLVWFVTVRELKHLKYLQDRIPVLTMFVPPQFLVILVNYDLPEVVWQMKAEWRSV